VQVNLGRERYLAAQRTLRQEVYRDDPLYRDSTTPLIEMVLDPKGCTVARAEVTPVVVTDARECPVATCVLIRAQGLPDTLQVAFFEALPGQEAAVELLVETARESARRGGATRIVAGMNGHVNNGLGFLAGPWDSPASFGSSYNPPYYIDYMRHHSSSEEPMIAYSYQISDLGFEREQRILDRALKSYTFRTSRLGDLRTEIGIYTDLNNRCFGEHPLYYDRSVDEDMELFRAFSRFLSDENFLIAEFRGEPVGFILWYPDFNELLPKGGSLGTAAFLKLKVLHRRIEKVRLAEIGVVPEHWGSGLILGLFSKGVGIARDRHSVVEAGWILTSNLRSKGLASRWADAPCRHYSVFEIDAGRS